MRARGFSHEALFYAGKDSFLVGTVPFIREAVAAEEPVMVAVDANKIELLRRRMSGEADRVRFVDMRKLGRNPALIISAWRDFVAESTANGGTCRGIGEPVWPGRSESELAECEHHESLLNLAFEGGTPWRLRCPYDAESLPPDVLAGAERNHPVVDDGRSQRRSDRFRDPAVSRVPFAGVLPEPSMGSAEMSFGSPGDLERVRKFVGQRALAEGIDPERAEGLALAVDEVVTNALLYGRRGGRLRAWVDDGRMICEVSGGGTISDPLVGRIRPDLDQLGGRGLWIANHFCDLLQIRSSRAGTVIRCHVALAGASAPAG